MVILPVSIFVWVLISTGFGIIMSVMFVFFQDIKNIAQMFLMLLLFTSTIFFKADLFYNDLSHLSNTPLSGKFVDISYLEDIVCDHLAFRGESLDWQLWVDRGKKPLFRKIVITYKKLPGEPQFSARLSEWDIQPSFSDTLFQFSIPKGVRRIQVLRPKRPNTQKRGRK